ncbi:DNA-binding protein [Humibacter sp. BT305]|uniref:DNA-binding protein n=1 Tax=Cnuibacter physcomitrellae TaxID=1619308 RepID=A0A1X9LIW9_9MICO|nr:Rv2175c family DNA-binding protein [Cnuibacter physcomitrellae]ARJ05136.1 DNA-binding protein [Cnuibacter physcomitrellae]AXH36214.1 DNA-binding protein [Humibacter sp. BT305]MCS5498693.1 Rv2175c family DNA-binding protein [Cnuibacter physcomitrellae]GGI35025.1 transcriptional regulator [Cnuibacter physcomitrellae]
MTEPSTSSWLTVPDLVEELGLTQSRVRRLIEERALVAVRRDGKLVVPALFLRDGEPLHELKGTVLVLADSGFDDEGIVDWLLSDNDTIGVPPIEALRAGRKTEVRRVAQALAL